ncbi:MAG: type III PLP-dependent enzyme [Alphaproteobacteria bacterium]|nr:type III PLP-dependent enzyme [Alphaproteobacteria bacterium]
MEDVFSSAQAVVDNLKPTNPVYCLRPHILHQSAQKFLDHFPGRILYAVKCNPHLRVLKELYHAGIHHFDTASIAEIALVKDHLARAEAYFMHPVKGRDVIKEAAQHYQITTYVIDHEDELNKVIEEYGDVKTLNILVRFKTPPVKGMILYLSGKFGADKEEAGRLLKLAYDKGCNVGLKFHVGSQCVHLDAYAKALEMVGDILDTTKIPIKFLDVGGGFGATYLNQKAPTIEEFLNVIKAGLAKLPLSKDCILMCEPGRVMVNDAMSLIVQVQLRKDDLLYINDGIYGALPEMGLADVQWPAKLLRPNNQYSENLKPFTLYGPTCDSADVLKYPFELPEDIKEGDWIEIDKVGAYSLAMATHFNGLYSDKLVIIDSKKN